ncbi:hypothetical protein [Frigoribacterium sp. CG_9.8]|nr:hypothetical protein [Frigoribacterium sp. CG_9.8]MBG6106594.1 hypothetical protein [Frigoribacterium sp. CG_9.8]
MKTFTSIVTIRCESLEQAEVVLAERLAHDEDYGFDYSVTENGATEATA